MTRTPGPSEPRPWGPDDIGPQDGRCCTPEGCEYALDMEPGQECVRPRSPEHHRERMRDPMWPPKPGQIERIAETLHDGRWHDKLALLGPDGGGDVYQVMLQMWDDGWRFEERDMVTQTEEQRAAGGSTSHEQVRLLHDPTGAHVAIQETLC